MHDAIVISDLHLGSDNCRAKDLVHFLECIRSGQLPTASLILNGDVFDSIDFRRLKKSHWKVLSLLRKLSDEITISWIVGNHDGSADIISHLLGVSVTDELILQSGSQRILFLHGHQFDRFITDHPVATWFADRFYRVLQKLDGSHRMAKLAKKNSKFFLRCVEKIESGAIDLARRRGCSAVCCGHTHVAVAKTEGVCHYYNSGCWTENPAHYLAIHNGEITVCPWESVADETDYALAVTTTLETPSALTPLRIG